MQLSIRARVFGLIQRYDVELAETYARLCPEVTNVAQLNRFFRWVLSQHDDSTRQERSYLDDTMTVDQWLRHFEASILPSLRHLRFPPFTGKDVPNFYGNPDTCGMSVA